MDISEKILITRKEKGFTQQILADKANLSLSTIKRIENGKVIPRVYTLTVLSEILEVELLPASLSNEKNENEVITLLISTLLTFLPPLHILFLLRYRSKSNKNLNRFLVFQSYSFILFLVLLFLVPGITYIHTGQKMYGQYNSQLILYISFIVFNTISSIYLIKPVSSEKDTSMTPD